MQLIRIFHQSPIFEAAGDRSMMWIKLPLVSRKLRGMDTWKGLLMVVGVFDETGPRK